MQVEKLDDNDLIIKFVEDLIKCNGDNCEGCSVLRQDEGDVKPYCGHKGALNVVITYLQNSYRIVH